MSDKFTAFLCPVDLLVKVKAKAERNRRSLSNYLICLIEKDVANEPTPAKAATKPKAVKKKPVTK